MGKYDDALPLYKQALEIREKVLCPEHPYLTASLNNLVELYKLMDKYDDALLLHKRTLEIVKKEIKRLKPIHIKPEK